MLSCGKSEKMEVDGWDKDDDCALPAMLRLPERLGVPKLMRLSAQIMPNLGLLNDSA